MEKDINMSKDRINTMNVPTHGFKACQKKALFPTSFSRIKIFLKKKIICNNVINNVICNK